MTRLSVNVNKVATLRNTRTHGIPSVVRAARLCLDAGAHGITVHPRPDQRHIRPHDVFEVANRITVLRLGRTVGVYERDKTTQQEVVHAITAGTPTKVAGIPDKTAEVVV